MATKQYLQTMHGWIDLLESKSSTAKQMKLKSGAFCELAAYDWIIRQRVKLTAQVTLTPNDVLGAKGAVIDGKMDNFWDTHFDIKGFGFNGYMAGRLKDLLESQR